MVASLKPGAAVSETYLLVALSLATTKNGNTYGAIRLGDRSGEIEGKVWDRAEELLAPFEPGALVKVSGRVEEYRGARQVVVSTLAPDPGAGAAADFLPASPVPLQKLRRGLKGLIASLGEPNLKRLLKAVFEDPQFGPAFERAPAAKLFHHAYVHGLLEHSLSLAALADKVAGHYPHINRDLLVAGALLHDIGKAAELSLGPPLEYSDQGRLLGHLVLGSQLLERFLDALPDFPPDLALHLRHLLVSHHGEREFGSPEVPKTAEALLLHMLDDLDAKTMGLKQWLEREGVDQGWSGFNRMLERQFVVGLSPWDLSEQAPEPADGNGEAAGPPARGLFDHGLAPDKGEG